MPISFNTACRPRSHRVALEYPVTERASLLRFRFGGSLSGPAKFEVALLACLVAGFYWLLGRTYEGLYHDAIVYALLVAGYIDPKAFSTDLFFLYGSQDSFSVFSPLYAVLIRLIGFDYAAKSVVLFGGLLWIISVFSLGIRCLKSVYPASFLLIFLAAAHFSYSPNYVTFQLNENFSTARVLAAPLALLAFSAWYSQHKWRSAAALLLAGGSVALHPLIGIWAPAIFLLERCSDRAVVTMSLLGLLAFFGLATFSEVSAFQPMDPDWADLVRASSRDVFVGHLDSMDLDRIMTVILLLWLGGRLGSEPLRRTYLLVSMLCATMFLVSQVCSYWWPIEIVMKAQPWRVTWIAMLFAALAATDLLWQGMSGKHNVRMLTVLMGVVVAAFWEHSAVFLAALLLLSMPSSVLRLWQMACDDASFIGQRIRRSGLHFLAGLILLLFPVFWVELAFLGGTISTPWWTGWDAVRGLLFGGAAWLSAAGLLALATYRTARRLLIGLLLPATVLGLMFWDTRLPASKAFEREFFRDNDYRRMLSELIPPGDVVAWPGMQQAVWFSLGRANYMAPEQAIGIVFSRAKAMESWRRAERIAASTRLGISSRFETPEAALEGYRDVLMAEGNDLKNVHKYFGGKPTRDGIPYLCEDPVLDWVISPIGNAKVAGRSWVKTFQVSGMGAHYVYACHA